MLFFRRESIIRRAGNGRDEEDTIFVLSDPLTGQQLKVLISSHMEGALVKSEHLHEYLMQAYLTHLRKNLTPEILSIKKEPWA